VLEVSCFGVYPPGFKGLPCNRYIKRFYDEDRLSGPYGFNAQSECAKIKTVARYATQVSYLTCRRLFPVDENDCQTDDYWPK
jgi:hypothetical protein